MYISNDFYAALTKSLSVYPNCIIMRSGCDTLSGRNLICRSIPRPLTCYQKKS